MTRRIKSQTKRFMITKIDPDLWRRFKSTCAFYGLPIREFFIDFMIKTVEDHEARDLINVPRIVNLKKELKKKC